MPHVRPVLHPVLLAGLVLLGAGCIPSNVIEETDRAVRLREEAAPWGPLDPTEFPGAYASERIEGDAAASLIEMRYVFHPDGTYTGAALTLGEPHLRYQTLDGTWTFDGGRLVLDAALAGGAVEAAGDRLRLAGETGSVVLRRFELR